MGEKTAVADKNKAKESPLDVAFIALASLFEQIGKYDAAYTVYNSILKRNPNSVGALTGRGMIELLDEQDDKALRDFHKAAAMAPRDRSALRTRAFAHMLSGNFDGAEKDFQKSLTENSEWDNLTCLLAYTLRQKDQPELAAQMLNEAVDGKIKIQEWPFPILQFLRGDIDLTTVMSIAFSKVRQLETRAYLGFCRAWSKNPEEGKPDLLFVQGENGGSPLVKLMAARGVKIIEEGHARMISNKAEKSDKMSGMDLL